MFLISFTRDMETMVLGTLINELVSSTIASSIKFHVIPQKFPVNAEDVT